MSRPVGVDRGRAWFRDWAGPLALAGLVILFTVACGRWMVALHEAGHTETRQDIASINQAVWNTSRGRVLRATILYEGVRDHLEPALLVYALNYAAGGTVHSLLYLHALAIGIGAVPFYALGRGRGLPVIEAWLMAAGYLLLPPLHRLVEKDYLRTDLLLFPALALLAYAVTMRRDRLALAGAALALCARESGALAVVGLGLHRLWVERRVPAGLALVGLGALWLPLVNFVWLPWLLGHSTQHADHIRPPTMLVDLLTALWRERWFVLILVATGLLLLRRRWTAVLAVPTLLALPFYRVALRYSAPLSSIVWMGAADDIAHWSRPGTRRAALVIVAGLFALANVALGSWRPPSDEGVREVRPLLAHVRADASVCAESRVLGHLSTRERLYQFNRQHYFPSDAPACLSAQYFLLNRSGRDTFFTHRRHQDRADAWREVEALGVETVAESGSWTLWRRRRLSEDPATGSLGYEPVISGLVADRERGPTGRRSSSSRSTASRPRRRSSSPRTSRCSRSPGW
jgi:uncharacterized membrane protein